MAGDSPTKKARASTTRKMPTVRASMMVDLPSLMTLEAMRATTQAFTPRRACCTTGMSAKLDRHTAMTEMMRMEGEMTPRVARMPPASPLYR